MLLFALRKESYMIVIVILFGICIGSFVNVVIYRFPLGLDFVRGRSFCPHCHHQLNWQDLIPVFSWILVRGKCRHCKSEISIRYMIIEIMSGILAFICFHQFGISFMMIFSFILSMILLCISVIDIDTMVIYGRFILCCLICSIISLWFDQNFIDKMIGFFIASVPMLVLNLFKECFGGGDIKLIAVNGFLLGWKRTLIAMYIAFILGGIYAFCLIIRKKIKINQYIAFGPFLCIGIFVSWLYGYHLIYFFFF